MMHTNFDRSADYFSLGVVAYECMTGKLPFRGNNKEEILNKMLKFKHKALIKIKNSDRWADYPPEAIDFITKCLKIDPEERV